MQKIKMKSTSAGPEGTMLPGEFHTVDDSKAKLLVDGGYADYETMTVNPTSINKAGKSPDVEEIKKLVEDEKTTSGPYDQNIDPSTEKPLVKPVWGKK